MKAVRPMSLAKVALNEAPGTAAEGTEVGRRRARPPHRMVVPVRNVCLARDLPGGVDAPAIAGDAISKGAGVAEGAEVGDGVGNRGSVNMVREDNERQHSSQRDAEFL